MLSDDERDLVTPHTELVAIFEHRLFDRLFGDECAVGAVQIPKTRTCTLYRDERVTA